MNKKLITLAVAGAFTAYGAAANAAEISGFAVIDYNLVDDKGEKAPNCTPATDSSCKNSKEGKFGAEAEIDVIHKMTDNVTVRVDTDLDLYTGGASNALDSNEDGTLSAAELAAATDTNSDTVALEQAFFAWDLAPVTLIGGVFNNPIGQEAEDSADWNFVTSSTIRSALDNQTALNGNNVAGVAVSGAAGPVTITGAYLNHISGTDGGNEENSLALVLNASPIAGLDLEFGLVTQESDTDADAVADNAGDVIDFNAQYAFPMVSGLTVGLDYATFDKIADAAYNLWGLYSIPGTKFSVGLRLEEFSWEAPASGQAATDVERASFYASYKAADNLKISLEVSDGDGAGCLASAAAVPAGTGCNLDSALAYDVTGVQTDALTKLKFIATF